MQADVVVLGAGMVGVSVAVHLQKRGKQVVLLDRRPPGEETSYGNGGLIQREAVFPHRFPAQSRSCVASPATAPLMSITTSPRYRDSFGRYSIIGATRSPSATPRWRCITAR
jgi:glycine/D-amino acid oxidase-like deaminating enzyme